MMLLMDRADRVVIDDDAAADEDADEADMI